MEYPRDINVARIPEVRMFGMHLVTCAYPLHAWRREGRLCTHFVHTGPWKSIADSDAASGRETR